MDITYTNNDFPNLSTAAKQSLLLRIDTRSIQTLLGICTGIIADEVITDKEISFLKTWILEHESICKHWPANAIHFRIKEIIKDGIITNEERNALMQMLQQITGNYFNDSGAAAVESPALPINDDPSIFFNNMTFCFTGLFMYGTRASCERVVLNLGAMPLDNVTKNLNYLVIGSMVSPFWATESYGRKIQKAIKLRDEDEVDICIISERQWTNALIDAYR